MTTNLDAIFSQYRKADFYDRLNIFLQFPELRREFLEIEQKEDQPNFFGTGIGCSNGCKDEFGFRNKTGFLVGEDFISSICLA